MQNIIQNSSRKQLHNLLPRSSDNPSVCGIFFNMKITVKCPCGKEFQAQECRIKVGRGKHCSKECMYKYMEKPRKVPHNYKEPHPNWFKKGEDTWNKGKVTGFIPPNHKGDKVGYAALHDWVSRWKVRPKGCEHCGIEGKRLEWANKSHEYKRDLDDWMSLCKKCHVKYDMESGNWGVATKKINLEKQNK